ncbi:MAG: type II toxin-antitoxin system HicB family antitoxin [Pirellulales bacterium]|nr:type II toxin-antitoxin system HicB family antitoxin [Pirellulales bacterium]
MINSEWQLKKKTKVISMVYRLPLVFTPQPEGGYTVTSPVLPEFLTEGNTLEEAQGNVQDAFMAVLELYADLGRALPASITLPVTGEVICSETLVGCP